MMEENLQRSLESELVNHTHGVEGKLLAKGPSRVKERVEARGKFLFVGEDKFWVKGVTYGTFRPDAAGQEFWDPQKVKRDFSLMAQNRINAVRTYTTPPGWLLDEAQEHGLRLMVGIPWEEHMAFLEDKERARSIISRVRGAVRACKDHKAVLCYAIGNEIPAPIVRWHGKKAIERFLRTLYLEAKEEDPNALVTYVNYPSTEYLEPDFVDLVCFNVYLESRESLEAYLYRLHNLAGFKPLVMAEIGLDSKRNGLEAQARSLDWQIRTAFATGCAGVFVFSWTDEWYRGGYDILDWDFGLTTRDRRPKPALEAVRRAFEEVPFSKENLWPKVSVVVCSYNGSRTIGDTLDGLRNLDYPNFEVIVVDDGSTDETPRIAEQSGARVISVPNGGLSRARNIGWEAAQGDIVAYIDDDAYPDPHWLQYLASSLLRNKWVGVGGPNIPPPGDGPFAQCVANSPGGPIHVLVTDIIAEHIPGCNMAFRKEALKAVGGFDTRFRIAGDDVDMCWRLQDMGWTIGYSPGAVVWHHRRNSIKAYLKQQVNYGKAEALLEAKWPQRYNALGHLSWGGKLYGMGLLQPLTLGRQRIYHGIWGTALFQSLYGPKVPTWILLPMMPEFYLILPLFAAFSAMSKLWDPLALAWVLLAGGILAVFAQAFLGAKRATFPSQCGNRLSRLLLRLTIWALFVLQPGARLLGRIKGGLTPWRRRLGVKWRLPWPSKRAIWSETWRPVEARLMALEKVLASMGAVVKKGGGYEPWDLEVRGGLFGGARLLVATEEHGGGRQQVLVRVTPRLWSWTLKCLATALALAFLAVVDGAWPAGVIFLVVAVGMVFLGIEESGRAVGACMDALEAPGLNWK